MADKCTIKGCPYEGKTFCRVHGVGISTRKQEKPPAKRSKKLDKTMRKQYVPEVKEMVKKNTECAVKSPVCTGFAQGFHHLVGRIGELLTNRKKKIPCCNPCNRFIEKNDAWARANGFKLSKFSEPAKNQKIGA